VTAGVPFAVFRHFPRQVTMKTVSRSLSRSIRLPRSLAGLWASRAPGIAQVPRGLKVLRTSLFFALLAAALPPVVQAQGPPAGAPALPPGVTPQQAEAAVQAIQSGAPLPPEAQKALEAHPELKDQLPPEVREKVEEKLGEEKKEDEQAKKSAAPREPQAAALAVYDWKTSVYVGNLFSKRLHESEVSTLTHFGHEVFAPRPGAAATLENMPVTPDYIIGPGDEVVVKLWGRMEGTHRMVVDRDGKIFFPKMGSFYVAGKTFSELKSFLRAKVSNNVEVSSDVSLGQMKGIRVSVVGEVRSPGWYNVSSLHTALQALYLAGGIRDIGSLRRIAVRRGSKETATIDLYDFLLKGNQAADTRLLQGDTILVPVVGKLVALTGEVRRPAIYELKEEHTLLDLVAMAGGFAPTAYKRRVQVERLEGHFAKLVLDLDAEELEQNGGSFELADGDIVRVLPIVHADINSVTLEGNVVRPGKYELKPGMTVGALLPDQQRFLPDTYFDYALLTRVVPPEMRKEVIPVNLREIVLNGNGEADVALLPFDTLTVFPRSSFRDAPKVTVAGEVRRPGAFDLKRGAKVSDLIKLAGDLTRSAYLPKAAIVRVDERHDFHMIYFDLGKAVQGDPEEDLVLNDLDEVRIHSIWETKYRKTVTVSGDVNRPGEYILTEGMCLSDLLFKVGGLKESAYAKEADLIRRTVNHDGSLVETEAIVVSPERALAGEDGFDIHLRRYDLLVVRQIPTWGLKYKKMVTVSGDVRNPGDFVLTDGMKLSDLLFRAGGLQESAYAKEAELVRREVNGEGNLVKTETIVVSPEKIANGGKDGDLPLKQFDLLMVRTIPDWGEKIQVALAGEVQFPGTYTVKKGERLSSVITRAGGFTPDAYLKAAQFTRVSTQKSQQEAIDKLIEELELEVSQKAQAGGVVLDREDIETNKEIMAARQAVIEQLKKTKAKGRVIIRLGEADTLKGTAADILLEDGDRLAVPKKMNVVNVVGRVYNPTGVVYDPANDRLDYYLKTVGGPTQSADRDHIFLIKADGSVVSRENAGSGFLSGGFMYAKVEPGDSIVVPEKLVQTRAMKDVKDITQILYQIAVTAGVLIVAF
jgi:polysaccharide biosynthesis/export protein